MESKLELAYKEVFKNSKKALLEDLEQGNIHENHLELVKEKLK